MWKSSGVLKRFGNSQWLECLSNYSSTWAMSFLHFYSSNIPVIASSFVNLKFSRMQSSASWRSSTSSSNSSRQGFSEDAWKRYNRRIQEEYEDEMERIVSFLSSLSFIISYKGMACISDICKLAPDIFFLFLFLAPNLLPRMTWVKE